MRRLILSLVLGIGLFISNSQAQLEVVFTANSVVPSGGQVAVDVSVNNFDNLISCQWSINWDSLVFNYNSVSNVTGLLQNFTQTGNIGTPDQGGIINPGQATVSWSLPSTNPRSIPNGTVLFTLLLDAVGAPCSNTTLDVTTLPLNIEAIVDDGNFTDIGVVGMSGLIEVDCGGSMPCGPNAGNPACNTGTAGGVVLYGSENISEMGSNVCVPITTDNFIDVQSVQFTLNWDASLLTYTGHQNVCPDLIGAYTSSTPFPDVFNFIWTSPDGIQASNKANGETIVEICFDVIGANNAYADISFTAVEVADSNQSPYTVLNDCGSVLICEEIVVTPDFTLKASDVSGQVGDEVCVDISACGFTDVASIQLTMAWDATIAQYNNNTTSIQNIHPSLTPIPLFNFFAPDNLRMQWNTSNSLGIDIADNEVLYSVCFELIGDCTMPSTSAFNFIDVPVLDIEIIDGNADPITPVLLNPGSISSLACPDACIITGVNVTAATCNGGTGTAVILGGVWTACDWTYNTLPWTNSNTDPCEIAAGLAGTYCVTLTDDMNVNCETCFDITEPPMPIDFIGTTKNIDCTGPGNINIANLSGGMPPYTTCWDDGFIGTNRDITTPGTYIVTVKDAAGCSSASMTYVISDLTGSLAFTEVIQNVSCSGLGTVTVAVTSGCPTYTFSSTAGMWVANVLTGLPVGSVDITVTDGNLGTVTKTLVIGNDVMPISVAAPVITNETCAGLNNGSIVLTISGGCAPYMSSAGVVNGDMVTDSPLAPGSYSYTITDAQMTMFVAGPYTVGAGNLIDTASVTITNTTAGLDNGIVCFDIIGGSGTYTITSTPAAGTQVGNCIEGLAAGDYDFDILDDITGCTWSTMGVGGNNPIEVGDDTVIEDPTITLTVVSEAGFNGFGVACAGDSTGIVAWDVTPADNISTIQFLVESTGITVDSTGLGAGVYILVVTLNDGSIIDQEVSITQPDPISVLIDTNCSNGSDGSIEATVTGGAGMYTYMWNGSVGSTNVLEDLEVGTNTLMVTDANGCVSSFIMDINVEDCNKSTDDVCYTSYNNIITPGLIDGINDVLEINCAGDRDNAIVIYDRWGRDVFTMSNYDNSWGGLNDGGVLLGEGTYFWVMDVVFEGESRLFKGFVTLLRD